MKVSSLTVRCQLFLFASAMTFLLLAGNLVVWYSNGALQRAETERQRLEKASLAFKDVRYHVVQIQQFLTDASAVGVEDFREAQEEQRGAHQDLERLRKLMPEMRTAITAADDAVEQLYSTGERMARAYIHQGRAAGNAIMKAAEDGFDAESDSLATKLDAFAVKLDKKVQSASMVQQKTMRSMFNSSAGLGIAAILLTVASNVLFSRRLMSLLGAEPAYAAHVVHEVATGDLSLEIKNQTGSKNCLVADLRDMVAQLSQQMREIDLAGRQIGQSAYQITDISQKISDVSEAEHARSSEVTLATEELRNTSETVMQLSDLMCRSAHMSRESAQKGLLAVQENIDEMRKAVEAAQLAESKMKQLNEANAKIQDITVTIESITDQTNLLALNAAIEAARAGENGRGFAVVADEVRKLAGSASQATSEISTIIDDLSQQLTQNMTSVEGIIKSTRAGMAKADSASVAIREIVTNIEENASTSEKISTVSSEQVTRISELLARLDALFESIDLSGSQISVTKEISVDLYKVTERLRELIGFFRFDRSWAAVAKPHEKRKHPRASNNLLVRVEFEGKMQDCITADFSMGGMQLRVPRPLAVSKNDIIPLQLLIPYENLEQYQKQTPTWLQGRVVWQRQDSGQALYGIQFVNLGEKERTGLQCCFDFFNHASSYQEVSGDRNGVGSLQPLPQQPARGGALPGPKTALSEI